MSEYKVKFEVFEGPLDLLLYLTKKQEVDIYDVNLTQLATQFIEYVEVMRLLDLEIAGEFLVMASTLMYMKSRELLPVDQQVTAEGEDDGEDPRWELIRQLVEYKKFKDAAVQLQTFESRQENVFPRLPVKPEFEAAPPRGRPDQRGQRRSQASESARGPA
jgi:segregation and condensation protein A